MKNKEFEAAEKIFIFGCCNSGTTILWKALLNHKDASGPSVEGQDLEDLPDTMRHYLGKSTFRLWAQKDFMMEYWRIEEDYDETERQKIIGVYKNYWKCGTRFITKSPADSMRARLIQSYFPDAYFIGIVRNPYAVSEGIVRKRKFDPDRPQFEGLFTTYEQAANQWLNANIILLSHRSYLSNYKMISYEDLVERPEETLGAVLEFCKLDRKGFNIPKFDKGLNDKQIERLTESQLEIITKEACPMIYHFNYPILGPKLRW